MGHSVFGNNLNGSKLYSEVNLDQTEVRECCLSVCAEHFVSQFAVQQHKDSDIQKYNFAFVLYGCETWSPTLGEERRLRMFEIRVLRRIFESKSDEVTGEWRKLHNEINDLYCSPNVVRVIKSRRMRWAGHVARMGEERRIHGFGGGGTCGKETTWETQA